jgi:hypothetical protein
VAAAEAGPISARSRATRMPASYACVALRVTVSASRCSAPLARMVRAAETARSTAEVISPSRAWVSSDSPRTRRETEMATAIPTASPHRATPSSSGSSTAMATVAPATMTVPVTISKSPDVTTARSRVVSAPTRESRSPVRRVSYSVIGRRNRCRASRRRVVSTSPSAVRCNR